MPTQTATKKRTSVKKFEIERFSLISPAPFEEVVARLEAAVGRPEIVQFFQAATKAQNFAELEQEVKKAVGPSEMMLFMKLDQGGILQKESGRGAHKMVRYLIGNPLIMKEMAKHVADAGSYAPVTILVDERADGVHLSYDRMTSFLAPYHNVEALGVAQKLDEKIESLLSQAAYGTGR